MLKSTLKVLAMLFALQACSKHAVQDAGEARTVAPSPAPHPQQRPADQGGQVAPRVEQTPLTQVTAKPSGATPVLVMIGGYNSCPTSGDPLQQGLQPMFEFLRSAMQTGPTPVPYLVSCYTGAYTQASYILSTSTDGSIARGSTAAQVQALQGLLATLKAPVVYLVGHSYGGWTAISAVLGLPAKYRIGGLITLDPISMVTCTPLDFLAGTTAGCLTAPTDFSAQALQTVAGRVGFWSNYYELNAELLHSGPIAQASSNILENYPSGSIAGHIAFATDRALAEQIGASINTSLQQIGN